MALSSLTFLIFLAGALLVYYLVPLRLRRYVLLAASAVFYLSYSPSAGLSLLATVGMTYGAGSRDELESVPHKAVVDNVDELAEVLGLGELLREELAAK